MTATSPAPTSTAPTTTALAPERTEVRFTTTHLLGLGRVAGSVRLVSGSATVDPASGDLLAVRAELDLASFSSGSSARDRAVASRRFLDVGAHPRASYSSTAVQRTGAGWLVRGELSARGATAAVDLHVAAGDLAAGGPVVATATVDRTRFGITVPAALAGRTLEVRITAHPAPVATAGAPSGSEGTSPW